MFARKRAASNSCDVLEMVIKPNHFQHILLVARFLATQENEGEKKM